MALSFEQIIDRANTSSPNAQVHGFWEYADGKRGYGKSFANMIDAKRFERANGNLDITFYNRDGDDID